MNQIIALGGGGFSMEPENPLLDTYILDQCAKANPKICFIPTASGDSEHYITKFYDFFGKQDCQPSHLSLFRPPTRDLESYLLDKEILYVGGGNTKNLLILWKEWGLDSILRKAWKEGILLAGISAGSICWFEEGVTDSYGDGLEPIKCLGFLKGSHCPHYDGETERRPSYHRLVTSNEIQGGIAADDGVAIHYIGEDIHKIVSSRPRAKAYRLQQFDHKMIETELETVFLGA
ncbi:Type 1 glutamine amidotransferase-like domain-containing protein [Halalkalibacterium halodurans]|uniref:Type 1 glutamine amidotransferase-like domain-containing protein n=1 Tax=Halalkalibacterium halodurans TaxID=86665 RepID=UPI002AA9A7B4|nr:Type 1 glutamine amidotransferase-like domain-containing protein [Halalkalibacterium halodurans]MDY7221188.1 Type 1 glutamine amidotransferase-like domain-containing protein [Halalkalibacterium halodurans]MDY7240427.1 Type 1 glutamine amidotransferase-like domain-containing protein [Halalkalibacterium halodurans]